MWCVCLYIYAQYAYISYWQMIYSLYNRVTKIMKSFFKSKMIILNSQNLFLYLLPSSNNQNYYWQTNKHTDHPCRKRTTGQIHTNMASLETQRTWLINEQKIWTDVSLSVPNVVKESEHAEPWFTAAELTKWQPARVFHSFLQNLPTSVYLMFLGNVQIATCQRNACQTECSQDGLCWDNLNN